MFHNNTSIMVRYGSNHYFSFDFPHINLFEGQNILPVSPKTKMLVTPPKSVNDNDKGTFDTFLEKVKIQNERITYNSLKLICEEFIDEFTHLMRLHMSYRNSLRIE